MSAIGNYIHFSKENYRKYGTRFDENSEGSSYSQVFDIFNNQKRKMLKEVRSTKSKNLKEIENYLNALMYSKNGDGNAEAMAAIDKGFNNIVKTEFAKANKGFVYTGRGYVDIDKSFKTLDSKSNQIAYKTLQKYANSLDYINKKVMKDRKISDEERNKLELTIKAVEKKLKEEVKRSGQRITLDDNLIRNINMCLKLTTLPWGNAIGNAFETFLGVASLLGDNNIYSVTDNMLKNTIVGTKGSKVQYDLSKFDEEFVNKQRVRNAMGKYQIDEHNEFLLSANTETQDKVDVVFKWKDETFNISAKNYKLDEDNSRIHILSGSSFLYLIQNEDPEFINHWLNTVTIAKGNPKLSKKELSDVKSKNFHLAHEAMKITLLVKALTGQGLGRNSEADTFVLNVRSKQHIYVCSMKKLVDVLAEYLETSVSFSKDYPYKIKMSFNGDPNFLNESMAQRRITNLILSLHQRKISVSIKPNLEKLN